jgi:alkylation response protein AidB-like acyl-CoA dehydrogenase
MITLRDVVLEHGLADPGAGRTAERLAWLMNATRVHDISLGRLAEAHLDAVSILHESDREPVPGCVYGVWASSSRDEPMLVDGRLTGTKRFCSGVDIVDRALVTVRTTPADVLVDVDVSTIRHDASSWNSPALVDTATGNAVFHGQPVSTGDVVGTAEWYLERAGFWHGACGPAACWAGGAIGLVDAAARLLDDDPHRSAHIGALIAAQWSLTAMLDQAGDEIDRDPADRLDAELRARSLRHLTERTCADVADRFSRAFGPRPFVADGAIAQRFADLHLYMRQHHGERELGAIADLARPSALLGRT